MKVLAVGGEKNKNNISITTPPPYPPQFLTRSSIG